jgi:hypothetical protein
MHGAVLRIDSWRKNDVVDVPGDHSRFVLHPRLRLYVALAQRSREPHVATLIVNAPDRLERGWGGRTNSAFGWANGGWVLEHMGHSLPIHVNGKRTHEHHPLRDGDVYEPMVGLRIRFVQPKAPEGLTELPAKAMGPLISALEAGAVLFQHAFELREVRAVLDTLAGRGLDDDSALAVVAGFLPAGP